MNTLGHFLRSRARELGLSMSEVARRSGKSRQTLHDLSRPGARLPELGTLIDVALVLGVHPLRLIHLVFDDVVLPAREARAYTQRGDKSVFLGDVTVPDGTLVMAGTRFTKVWAVQNVGTVVWRGRTLRCIDEEVLVSTRTGERVTIAEPLEPVLREIPVPETPPGGIVRLAVDFIAPKLPGSCVSYWKSFHADGRMCMPRSVGLSCVVRVLSMRATDDPEQLVGMPDAPR